MPQSQDQSRTASWILERPKKLDDAHSGLSSSYLTEGEATPGAVGVFSSSIETEDRKK